MLQDSQVPLKSGKVKYRTLLCSEILMSILNIFCRDIITFFLLLLMLVISLINGAQAFITVNLILI